MTKLCRLTLIAVLTLGAGCGTAEIPTAPATLGPPPTPPPAPQPAAPVTPPEAGPFRAFVYSAPLSHAVSWYTSGSQFRLYDNGSFTLAYPHGAYRGSYAEVDGVITFTWEGWSIMGPWGAIGTLQDGTLTVHYNLVMELSDFEDAAYVRAN